MKHNRYLWGLALLVVGTLPAFSQVSNDNEDGVYKSDGRFGAYDFEPGQVLVKFKDESTIQVRSNEKGKFRAANINSVDRLLREYDVDVMEKLYPAEVAKPASQLRQKRAPNGTIVKERNLDKVFWVKTKVQSLDSTLQLIEELKAMPEVEYAEPNYRVYITADMPKDNPDIRQRQTREIHLAPVRTETDATVICENPGNNPLYSQQYGITQQNIHTLWNKRIINKKRPVIAILDTGVDITHPDLKDNIWQNTLEIEGEKAFDDDGNGIVDDRYGWNFVEDYYDLTDYNGHGTHVAGIAAAADNNIGVVGANPFALIMPVKVMGNGGSGDIATICRGMIYAADNGADIINMSFGHAGSISNAEIDAIHRVYQTTILVASAGNNGASVYDMLRGPLWPAAYYLVLGVQASDASGNRVSWSNYDPDGPIFSEDGIDGRNHEIMVPGVDIYSTVPDGNYKMLSGTSMSAPLFAGAVSALQMVKEYPSKDVLFGDLIHLNADFEKIYSDDTPRFPDIGVVALLVDDTSQGNGDGQVDAGEIVDFSCVLRNTWADASDIKLKLMVDDEYWEFANIRTQNVDFGHSMSAYGRETAKNPFNVKFANNIGDNTRIKFTMEITCAESSQTFIRDVYVTVHNMVKIGGLISSDMILTADKTYLVTSNLAIPEGVTLTVEPGTVIKFNNTGVSNSGTLIIEGTPQQPITLCSSTMTDVIKDINTGHSTISYCKIDNIRSLNGNFQNCVISNFGPMMGQSKVFNTCNMVSGIFTCVYLSNINSNYCNFYDCRKYNNAGAWIYGYTGYNANIIESVFGSKPYSLWSNESSPQLITLDHFPYLGSGREDIVRQYIADIHTNSGYGEFDLSNMPTRPYAEAHGLVWKVVVNGYDAQDEYEQLPPLGVGRHKFEVYFNRPMNKEKIPQITFGVREPYTQHSVDEDGSWNEEGTIYTAYKTITGRTMSDGVNRIYVKGAEDNEFFDCPDEKTRFRINLQAAGSMATGFMAEAGLGRVNLTWNNENNDFEDAMGFNIYRFNPNVMRTIPRHRDENGTWVDETQVVDTVCINKDIVDIEATEYTDYDVIPGETYYYLYKVLSTDLQEYDVSNIVAVTPLTASLGDANGSGEVDVADVITTVNYAAGQQPKPFIFEAADMNTDNMIDILDVIGIIQTIINPNASAATASIEATATYTIEDGVLFVESPVALAGVQAQLNVDGQQTITVAEDLDGFEHTSAWLSDNDYLFLAYNMNGKTLSAGKHALLYIGDANLSSLRLGDALGHNVMTEAGQGTPSSIDKMGSKVMKQGGVFNLKGQKVAGKSVDMKMLPKGVYIINGQKVVK